MHELLPKSRRIPVTQSPGRLDNKTVEAVDQLLLILPRRPRPAVWNSLPQGSRLRALMKKRRPTTFSVVETRLPNKRQTRVVLGTIAPDATAFEQLTLARRLVTAALGEKPGCLGVAVVGFEAPVSADGLVHNVVDRQ